MDIISLIESEIKKNEEEIVKLIQDLVRIPSLPGESKEAQLYLKDYLENMGLEVDLIKVEPKELEKYYAFTYDGYSYKRRYILIGKNKGEKSGKSLILNGHVDVVPVGNINEWEHEPFSGHYEGGRIFGRGSLDMKAGLCSGIVALKILKNIGFVNYGDLYISSVCGEETGGCGSLAAVNSGLKGDACIILEPTKLNISHIQAGAVSFKLKVYGKSIHACMKNKGVSALDNFIKIYEGLNKLDTDRHGKYSNRFYEDKYNVAPFSVGMVKCGEWPSSVPDVLEAVGRLGVFPNETIEEAQMEFSEKISSICNEDDWLRNHVPEIEWFEGRFESTETDVNEDIVRTLYNSHKEALGRETKMQGVTYGSDMRIFNIYGGIPTVLYGPGDVEFAHSCNESISLEEVMEAVKSIALTIVNWCGGRLKE